MSHCNFHGVDSEGTCPVCIEEKIIALRERQRKEEYESDLFLFCDVDQIDRLLKEANGYDMGPCLFVKWEKLSANTDEILVHLKCRYSYPFRDNSLKERWSRRNERLQGTDLGKPTFDDMCEHGKLKTGYCEPCGRINSA